MAIEFFSGFETGDFGEWPNVIGSPAIDDGTLLTPHTGDYHMRSNTSEATAYIYESTTRHNQLSVYVYFHAIDGDEDMEFLGYGISGGSCHLELTTDRYIKLYSDASQLDGTGSTQLDLDTWYRISFAGDGNVGGNVKVFLNGSEELSVTITGLGNASIVSFVGINNAATVDFYYNNVVLGTASDLSDLGDIQVLRASPNEAGQYATFDTVVPAQAVHYTVVDEVPASDDDYVQMAGSGLGRECHNLQDLADIGGSGTVQAVKTLLRWKTAGGTAYDILVRDNATDYTTRVANGKAYAWTPKLYVARPSGGAWDEASFNAFQSGGQCQDGKDMYISCVHVMVAFTPEEGPPPAGQPYTSRVQGVQGMRSWGGF